MALGAAGYRAVAPDMRGYGHTDAPLAIEGYSWQVILADMTALMDALGCETAVLCGHDWGAILAWFFAVAAPERFPTMIVLSVPPGGLGCWSDTAPMDALVAQHGTGDEGNYFYTLCHCEDFDAVSSQACTSRSILTLGDCFSESPLRVMNAWVDYDQLLVCFQGYGEAWPFTEGVYTGPAEEEYNSDPARMLRMMFFTGRASSCRALQVRISFLGSCFVGNEPILVSFWSHPGALT